MCLQLEIEKLKAENDRLKVENQGSRMGSQASISSSPPPHTHSQAPGTGLSQHSLNLTTSESTSLGKTEPTSLFFKNRCIVQRRNDNVPSQNCVIRVDRRESFPSTVMGNIETLFDFAPPSCQTCCWTTRAEREG